MTGSSKRPRRRKPSRSPSPAKACFAYVVVSKYVDHLPLHRLSGIFAREGVDLSRTTLCDWVADAAAAVMPIAAELRAHVVAASYLQTDDTTITVLGDDGGSYKGRLWTYLDPLGHQVVFDATPTHEGMAPRRSSPPSRASSERMRTPGMTACTRPGAYSRSPVWRTRAGGSSTRS
jgi:hypothetical protein